MTLNIWGGHVREPLLSFIKSHQHVDIFCFQEVYHNAQIRICDIEMELSLNILSEFQNLLPNHKAYFRPMVNGIYGIAMFVKDTVEVLGEGEFLIYENPDYKGSGPTHSRVLQWLKCQYQNQLYHVINVHGLWNGKGKTDAPERILQSKKIREFLDDLDTSIILCGDLNLRPDTESLKLISDGMRNLIEEYDVISTRTSYYPKEEKFADYIFTCPNVNVSSFAVLEDEVSDHAALLLEIA